MSFTWRCPSNIAFVKYWGKKPNQLPCNASLSMILSASYSEVRLELKEKKSKEEIEIDYFFENKKNELFEEKVKRYIEKNRIYFPSVLQFRLRFDSTNSFPHSAGIASSASAFGAIALALLDAEYSLTNKALDTYFYQKASSLARLGSGSASRSILPAFSVWGKVEGFETSSDEFAVPVLEVHKHFQNLKDTILIVDNQPKSVSSTIGHSLMQNHPFASNRFTQANERVKTMIEILRQGDEEQFIHIVESEALTLHAMMMTSNEYYLLMKPNTLQIIEEIWRFRKQTNIPICFTLDAGPNVHIIYPESYQKEVRYFLKNNCNNYKIDSIFDEIGLGPKKMNEIIA